MASAQFTFDGVVPTTAVSVTESTTHALALVDAAGVRSVAWTVVSSHASTATEPTITPTGSPSGATASITFAAGSPQGFMIQCQIDGGIGVDGKANANYTARAIIGVENSSGYVPFVPSEELERSATHGLFEQLNANLSGGVTVSGDGRVQAANLSELRALVPTAGVVVSLQGRLAIGDGGQGDFYPLPAAGAGTYVDDGGLTVIPSLGDGSTGWRRMHDGEVSALWWGTDGTAIQAAADAVDGSTVHSVLIPSGTWAVSAKITLPSVPFLLRGAGQTETVIDWTNAVECFESLTAMSGVTIKDLRIEGEWASYLSDTPAYHPVVVWNADNVTIQNVGVHNCTRFAIVCRNCTSVSVTHCHISECGRDGISLQACSGVVVTHNRIEHIDDDAITLHSEGPSHTGTYRQGAVIANNYIADAQGIVALNLRRATISGNTIERCRLRGIYVGLADAASVGDGSTFSVSIVGNTILDIYDRLTIDALSSNAFYIGVDGGPAAGTGVAVPGQPNASGTFEPMYSSLDDLAIGSPTPPPTWLTITGNTCARTREIGVSYSTYGWGSMFTRNGYVDPTITDAIAKNSQIGVFFGDGIRHCAISSNTFNGMHSCVRFSGSTGDVENVHITGNIMTQFSYGIVAAATAVGGRNVFVQGNTFDADPYHEHTNRGSAGGWTTGGSPYGVFQDSLEGVTLASNVFRNVNTIADKASSAGTNALVALANMLECNPASAGFSTSNGGIGNVPRSGQSFVVRVIECDPTNAAFGDTLNVCQVDSNAMPSTGTYVAGHFVKNNTGSDPFGWLRITTGSAHVLGTDWYLVGSKSLEYIQFGSDPPTVTGAVRLSDGEYVRAKFADSSEGSLCGATGNTQVFGSSGKDRNDHASAFNFYVSNVSKVQLSSAAISPTAGESVTSGRSASPWTDLFADRARMSEYTVASLPSATTYGYSMVLVTDGDSGSPTLAFARGGQWLRLTLGAAVSAT